MRHFETLETAGSNRPNDLPRRRAHQGTDLTAIREKAHVLIAGNPALITAPVFELRAGDARRYQLQLNGSGRSVTITRQNGAALTALREVNLPLNRPVILLIEDAEAFSGEDQNAVASLAGIVEASQTLCPGSLILCGPDRVFWA